MVRKDPIFEARTSVKVSRLDIPRTACPAISSLSTSTFTSTSTSLSRKTTQILTHDQLHSNRLRKEASRAEAASKLEQKKAENAIKKGELQIARIHAASAVREDRRRTSLRSEAARADVILNELKAAQGTRDTSRTLVLASRGLKAASASVNLEHLVSQANNFLASSEDLKIASAAIDDVAQGVSQQTDGAEGQHDVDRLMEKLAHGAGVDMRMALEEDKAPKTKVEQNKVEQPNEDVEDGLGARLRALRAAS